MHSLDLLTKQCRQTCGLTSASEGWHGAHQSSPSKVRAVQTVVMQAGHVVAICASVI